MLESICVELVLSGVIAVNEDLYAYNYNNGILYKTNKVYYVLKEDEMNKMTKCLNEYIVTKDLNSKHFIQKLD